jgi:O-antigen/teichoic acid export membrane protein
MTALRSLLSRITTQKVLLKDSTWVFAGTVVNILLGMLTTVVLTRTLPMGDVGRYQLLIAYLAMAQIATLPGMNVMVNKAVMKGHDGVVKPLLLRSLTTASTVSILVIAAGAIAMHLNREVLGVNLVLTGFFLPVLGFDKSDSIFMGRRNFKASRIMSTGSALGSLMLIGATSYVTKDVRWVIAAMLLSRSLSIAVCFLVAYRMLRISPPDEQVKSEFLDQGWKQSGYTILVVLSGQADKILLGSIDLHLLAIYAIASIFPSRIKDNLKLLFGVIAMHWAALPKRENFLKVRAHWWKIVSAGALMTFLVLIGAPLLIPLLYGDSYRDAVLMAQIMSLTFPIIILSFFIGNADVFQNKGVFANRQSFFRQVGYLGLLAFLAPKYATYGIIYAQLITEMISGLAWIFYFLRQLRSI